MENIIERRFEGLNYKYIKNFKNKNTLLFLHGFTGDSSMWDEQLDNYTKRYNLLLIDLVGHGKSYSPNKIEDYYLKNNSQKIIKLLKKLNISSISLICYSYSCYIGLTIHNQIPEKIDSVVFISPYFKEKYNFFERGIINTMGFLWKFLVPNKKHQLDYSKIKNYENPKWSDTKYILRSTNTKDVIGIIYSLGKLGKIPNLTNFKSPLLIIYGDKDKRFSSDIKELFKKLKNIEFKIIKDKKHLFLKTKSSKIANYIIDFLAKNFQK